MAVRTGNLARAGDSKVSPLLRVKSEPIARKRGNGWKFDIEAKARNSVGTLPATLDEHGNIVANGCADSTPFCHGAAGSRCYAANSASYRPAVATTLAHNLELERNLSPGELAHAYRIALWEYTRELRRHHVPRAEWLWREKWSGDHTPATAQAFADAIRDFPELRAWVYTRSVLSALILAAVPNVTVYASVDAWNVDMWAPVLEREPRIHVAACDETIDDARKLHAKLNRGRIVACPENIGRLPIAVPLAGLPVRSAPYKGEMRRGACVACRICPDGKADVAFSTRGR